MKPWATCLSKLNTDVTHPNNESMTDGFYMTPHRILTEALGNHSSVLGRYVVVVLTSGML